MSKLCGLPGLWRRDEQWLIAACLLFLSLCSGIGYARWRSAARVPSLFEEAPGSQLSSTAGGQKPIGEKTILVHVVGAVRNPGVLKLPASARVINAIEHAGGAIAGSDVQSLNLAARLQDGQQINVPVLNVTPVIAITAPDSARPQSADDKPISPQPINVNTASAATLESLPGVGPAIAARIVQYREHHGRFERIEDLDAVEGIGARKLEKLRGWVTF